MGCQKSWARGWFTNERVEASISAADSSSGLESLNRRFIGTPASSVKAAGDLSLGVFALVARAENKPDAVASTALSRHDDSTSYVLATELAAKEINARSHCLARVPIDCMSAGLEVTVE